VKTGGAFITLADRPARRDCAPTRAYHAIIYLWPGGRDR
jgi:hypothetical protein